jgi:hypothetical protein
MPESTAAPSFRSGWGPVYLALVGPTQAGRSTHAAPQKEVLNPCAHLSAPARLSCWGLSSAPRGAWRPRLGLRRARVATPLPPRRLARLPLGRARRDIGKEGFAGLQLRRALNRDRASIRAGDGRSGQREARQRERGGGERADERCHGKNLVAAHAPVKGARKRTPRPKAGASSHLRDAALRAAAAQP